MSAPAFTPEQDRQVAKEYEAGACIREIAEKYGTSRRAVTRALERSGTAVRPKGKETGWSPDKLPEAIRLYEDEDWTVRELARFFQARTTTVTEALESAGVTLKPGGRPHPRFRTIDQCKALVREYEAGASVASLTERHGCSIPAVTRAIQRGGGQLRPSGVSQFWTEEMERRVADAYRAGQSQEQIAAEIGISQTAVSRRLISMGVIARVPRRRERHPLWKGGRNKAPGGYIQVIVEDEDRPFAKPNGSGYVLEHRLVMGRAIGRPLTPHETVHHINGDRTDNRLENLQLRQGKHGAGVVMRCASCGSHDVEAAPIKD